MRLRQPVLAAVCVIASACGSAAGGGSAAAPAPAATTAATATPGAPACQNVDFRTCMAQRNTPPPTVIDPAKTYAVTVHTSQGDFTLKLDSKVAPVTVNNFVYLAQEKYYDGLIFHRVVPGFVVQGGDPSGNGTGGPGYKLPNETNPSQWPKGTVGMASSAAGVNGSQFFITIGDAPHLSGSGVYNHFGSVASGQDVVDQIKVGTTIKSIDVVAS